MTISVHSPTTALPPLDTLVGAGTGAAGASAPDQAGSAPAQDRGAAQPSAILALSSTGGLAAQTQGLAQAATIVDAAASAGGAIASLLAHMRQAAKTAADPATDEATRGKLSQGFSADRALINQLVAQAKVGAVNLLDGSAQGGVTIGSTSDPGSTTLTGANLTLGGPVLGAAGQADIADPAAAASQADALGGAISGAQAALDQIVSQGQAVQGHLGVLIQASLSLSPGLSGGVGSALDQDGARLHALQVQQQLAGNAGAVANQTPQSILALFR